MRKYFRSGNFEWVVGKELWFCFGFVEWFLMLESSLGIEIAMKPRLFKLRFGYPRFSLKKIAHCQEKQV